MYDEDRKCFMGNCFDWIRRVLGINALSIAYIDIFFDGWWTLFIIIPCFIGLFNDRDRTGNLIGLVVGV